MRVVISGLGDVGSYLADMLVREGHELTLIDSDVDRAVSMEEQLDANVIRGSAAHVSVLKDAKVHEADLYVALASMDEVNIVSASLAKALGARRVMARCHASTQKEHHLFPYASHFNIDYFIRPERLAAARIAKEIRSPMSPVIDQFARGTIEVLQVDIPDDSKWLNTPLCDLKLPRRMRVGLVKREDEVFIPDAQTTFVAGDHVILIGEYEAVKEASGLIQENQGNKRIKIVLYGAGDVGTGLIEYFSPEDAEIKLIEPNLAACERVSSEYPWVSVVNGHATSSRLLLEENVMDADVFVAATKDDEFNVMSCLQAVKFGIRPCLLTIHRPDYAGILVDIDELLGISAIVSPRLVTGEEILRYVTKDPYLILWELPGGYAQVIELRLQAEKSEIFGIEVKELPWPKGVLLLGIERADEIIVPTADDLILSKDSLFLLTMKSSRNRLLELFSTSI